jgi:hypothetical protein
MYSQHVNIETIQVTTLTCVVMLQALDMKFNAAGDAAARVLLPLVTPLLQDLYIVSSRTALEVIAAEAPSAPCSPPLRMFRAGHNRKFC